VSSLGAAAAAVGHELTVPGISQSVVVTRLPGRTNASMPERESMAAFSSIGATTAVFLSGARGEELQAELLRAPSAFSETTPAIVVVRASWPDEQVIRTTVGCLAAAIASSGASRTLLVLVGEALSGMTPSRSHLYSPTYAHAFRRRSLPGSTRGRPARRGRAEWR
jgi:precorrin-4/cobalt-precorrin-4 C11-methyltransferase